MPPSPGCLLFRSFSFPRRVSPSPLRKSLLIAALGSFAAPAFAIFSDPSAPVPLKAAANPVSEAPHLIPDSCAQPVYPPEAFAAGTTGSVLLKIAVTADGRSERVDVSKTSGNAQLDAAAVEAMRQCRFSPATKNGAAVASAHVLRYTFRIDDSTPEQIAARARLKAIIEVQGMASRVETVTGQCGKLEGLVADNARQAARQWQERNGGIVKQANALQNAVLAELRQQSDDAKAAEQKDANSRKAMQKLADDAAAAELASLESVGDEKDEHCQLFNSRTMGGEFDLRQVIPESVQLIEAASAAPRKP